MANFHSSTKDSINRALRLFHRAIAFDPQFAPVYGMAAWCYVRRKGNRWASDQRREAKETARLVVKAIELGREDAVAFASAGYAMAYVVGDLDQGSAMLDLSLALNPNLAWAPTLHGWPKIWQGDHAASLGLEARAMKLSPRDSQVFLMEAATAFAHLCDGRFSESAAWAAKAFTNQPNLLCRRPFSQRAKRSRDEWAKRTKQ